MKRIVLVIILMFPLIVFSQKSQLNAFFDKYSGQEGYTSVHITKYLFQMFAKISNDQEDKEFKEVTSKLTAIKILTVDSTLNVTKKVDFGNELKKILPTAEYKDLMIVKDGKKTISFMIRESNNKISELVMTISGPGSPVFILLEGDIDLANMSKLSKKMKINEFEHLEDIDENK